jgi:hypothetical protein
MRWIRNIHTPSSVTGIPMNRSGTIVQQILPTVDPRCMSITPRKLDGIGTDLLNSFQIVPTGDIAIGGRRLIRMQEHSFTAAACARASIAKLLKGVPRFMSVAPGD